MLEARSLRVRIGAATLLADVSLGFQGGELGVIVGPNGAGKTTLLAVLAGERRPTQGEVRLDGRPLASFSAAALAMRRAVLPQSSHLQFHFTVREVVALGCAGAGERLEARQRRRLVDEALEAADVLHLKDRSVPTLSGGERQRVHFARCLAQLGAAPPDGTRLLLLDEPTASLDPEHQHHVMQRARRMADRGFAVVAVLHDLNLAAAYGDRLVVLDRGRLDYAGGIREGLTRERIDRVFDVDSIILEHPVLDAPLVVTGARPAGTAAGIAPPGQA